MHIIWSFSKVPVVAVDIASIGIVESIDGEPLPKGRVLGDEVEYNQFQEVMAQEKRIAVMEKASRADKQKEPSQDLR